VAEDLADIATDHDDDYVYRCVDRSVLLPHYRKLFVAPFYRLVPQRLTANLITLSSSALMWVLLGCCLFPPTRNPLWLGLLLGALLQTYLLGDHLDGMRARLSRTSSPLGEFLDHYLDIYNGAIIVLASFFLLRWPALPVVAFTFWLYFLSFGATMVEEKERDELYFGRLGSLEGIHIISLFFFTWTIPGVRTFWLEAVLWGHKGQVTLIGFTCLNFVLTTFGVIWRLKYCPKPFAFFAAGSLGLALLAPDLGIGHKGTFFIMMLYGADYIGRVMGSYHLKRSHPYPDIPATAAFVLLKAAYRLVTISTRVSWAISAALLAYLGLRLAWGLFGVLHGLRRYWRWANP